MKEGETDQETKSSDNTLSPQHCPQLWKMTKQAIKSSFYEANFVQKTELFHSLSRNKTELEQRVSLQAAHLPFKPLKLHVVNDFVCVSLTSAHMKE